MKTTYYSILVIVSMVCGLLLYAYTHEWIIIQYPAHMTAPESAHQIVANQTIKKRVKLIFWRHGKWNTEHQELIWTPQTNTNIHYLINSWLTLLDEETILDKKVTVQTVIMNASGQEAYLSFDQNPLNPELSTHAKLMIIEGLLKTLRDNGIKITSVRLLVHHQPLVDDHLDFANPWPLTGFLP